MGELEEKIAEEWRKIEVERGQALDYIFEERRQTEGKARAFTLRGLIKRLAATSDMDTMITVAAWGLVIAGYEPTQDRISFLTRHAGRNPPEEEFEHPDLVIPQKASWQQ